MSLCSKRALRSMAWRSVGEEWRGAEGKEGEGGGRGGISAGKWRGGAWAASRTYREGEINRERRSIRLGRGRRAVGGLGDGQRGNVGEYPAWTELMECQRCRVAATARCRGSGRDDRSGGSSEKQIARSDARPQMIRRILGRRAVEEEEMEVESRSDGRGQTRGEDGGSRQDRVWEDGGR